MWPHNEMTALALVLTLAILATNVPPDSTYYPRSALIIAQRHLAKPSTLEAGAVVTPGCVQVFTVDIERGQIVSKHEVSALRNIRW